jgi:hypothetical protein
MQINVKARRDSKTPDIISLIISDAALYNDNL